MKVVKQSNGGFESSANNSSLAFQILSDFDLDNVSGGSSTCPSSPTATYSACANDGVDDEDRDVFCNPAIVGG